MYESAREYDIPVRVTVTGATAYVRIVTSPGFSKVAISLSVIGAIPPKDTAIRNSRPLFQ